MNLLKRDQFKAFKLFLNNKEYTIIYFVRKKNIKNKTIV